jgi:hypothetical protein
MHGNRSFLRQNNRRLSAEVVFRGFLPAFPHFEGVFLDVESLRQSKLQQTASLLARGEGFSLLSQK